ncbi:adenosylmethionine-8-amino-7-oxononanoate aminotransferase [Sinobaca qinghaiensis]|uniref:Adenosylmethionine-8-amino-7-oxononanoate aminotransferase n=1 Tax=Sinobaca qinghaiensis TaxID=342944 RepID=A0A419V7V3_9BACL|nr:aspartate aminotransferase family protein [Sinobaca qinghaiensis]RKD76120.1 adenosylmethionine-8-amino-7-oxononanoate aminotransferase [Sinobaca qinghaiensis]
MNEKFTAEAVSPAEWYEKDEELVWHAMRPGSKKRSFIASKAEGAWLEDIDGNRYLDAMAGLWCVNAGYGRKEIAESVYEQLLEMPFYPLTQSHKPAIQLAEKLNEWLGGDYVIFFSNSGSEANETAFKIARQYFHQKGEAARQTFISRYRSYHGNTMATLAATGQAQRKYKYGPGLPGFVHVSPPDHYRSGMETEAQSNEKAVQDMENVMNWELGETIAGVIMEPIITGGGVLVPGDTYMKRVQDACRKNGALLISDEVICGFGRTGKPFGFQHFDVQPDIVTMAKGITSGYLPLSATAVKREIYESFQGTEAHDHFRHVNTFGGSPASCAAALANLEIMEKEKLSERSEELGRELQESLQELLSLPHVGDVRGRGLLAGIEFVETKENKQPWEEAKVAQIVARCKDKGIIIGKTADTVNGFNNIITLSPPLSLTREDFDFLVKTLKETVREVVTQ